jgi:hypothetical protein
MYIVAQHQNKDPQPASSRGEKLIKNEGAPQGVRGLQCFCQSEGLLQATVAEANRRGTRGVRPHRPRVAVSPAAQENQ